MQNKKTNYSPLVYSTDPNFAIQQHNNQKVETLLPAQQKMKVKLDKKNRAGKMVTLIENFVGAETDMNDLCKKLKTSCGTGGAVKDGEIVIQGNNVDKVLLWLMKNEYIHTKKI